MAAKSALSSTISAVKCPPTDLYQSLTNHCQRLWQVEWDGCVSNIHSAPTTTYPDQTVHYLGIGVGRSSRFYWSSFRSVHRQQPQQFCLPWLMTALGPMVTQTMRQTHHCSRVSEQFLNGTSAQYRLYSAIQIKS